MRWYDYLNFPWAVNKYLWEKLRPEQPQEPGRPPQTSCYGRPRPLAYGKIRLTGNVLYAGAVDVSAVQTGAPTIVGICDGPVTGISRVWHDQRVIDIADADITVYTGERSPPQAAWTSVPVADRLNYPGTVYVAAAMFLVSDRLPQMSFEVQAILYNTGGAAGDANPADIWSGTPSVPAYSMLCNPDYGAGFPYDVVTDTGRDGNAASSARRYVEQEGLWISPKFTDARPAREYLQSTLDATNCTALWRPDGKLEIVPLGDSVVGTYAPDVTVQYALGPGDFLPQDDGDRIKIEIPPESDIFNVAPIEFLERSPASLSKDAANSYNASTVDDPEPVDIALRGERRAPVEPLHSICLRSVATKISRIRAQRMVQARARYTFKLPWRYALLEPLDFVTITDPLLGLSAEPVRIESIDEDEERALTVEAMQWPAGCGNAGAVHATQSSDAGLPSMQSNQNAGDLSWLLQGQAGELWPNGTSEISPPDGASLTSPAFANRVQGSAWAGSWMRGLKSISGATVTMPGPTVAAVPGHTYKLEARIKTLYPGTGAKLTIAAHDANGTVVGSATHSPSTGSTWVLYSVSLLVPSDSVSITPELSFAGNVANQNAYGYFDAISFYRSSTTPPTLTASLTPGSVSGECHRSSAGSCTATTGSVTASGAGGVPTYTYAWEHVSGDTFTANSPTSAATTFSKTAAAGVGGTGYTGTYRCVVTDHDGTTANTGNVTVTTTHYVDL